MAPKTVQQVLQEHTEEWLSIPGVVGTALGELDGRPCINVLVLKRTEALTDRIPAQVDGFPVLIKESGQLRALDSD